MTDESPRITHLSWGRLEVEGEGRYKDAKLWPGGSSEWNWNETGTRHVPGIQISDVEELLKKGAERIVLSRGMQEVLQICPETLQFLKEKEIPFDVLQTEKAVAVYNQCAGKERVGALIHSTC